MEVGGVMPRVMNQTQQCLAFLSQILSGSGTKIDPQVAA